MCFYELIKSLICYIYHLVKSLILLYLSILFLYIHYIIITHIVHYVTTENRILDALSVFLSVPLPKKAGESDNNPHVSILIDYSNFIW